MLVDETKRDLMPPSFIGDYDAYDGFFLIAPTDEIIEFIRHEHGDEWSNDPVVTIWELRERSFRIVPLSRFEELYSKRDQVPYVNPVFIGWKPSKELAVRMRLVMEQMP